MAFAIFTFSLQILSFDHSPLFLCVFAKMRSEAITIFVFSRFCVQLHTIKIHISHSSGCHDMFVWRLAPQNKLVRHWMATGGRVASLHVFLCSVSNVLCQFGCSAEKVRRVLRRGWGAGAGQPAGKCFHHTKICRKHRKTTWTQCKIHFPIQLLRKLRSVSFVLLQWGPPCSEPFAEPKLHSHPDVEQ